MLPTREPVRVLSDPVVVEKVLAGNRGMHAYELADLSEPAWSRTEFYADEDLRTVALLYDKVTLMCYVDSPVSHSASRFLRALAPTLPDTFVGHFTIGLDTALDGMFATSPPRRQLRMSLEEPEALAAVGTAGVVRLDGADLREVEQLYQAGYPDNWFDPRTLDGGHYVGVRDEGRLTAVAGIQALSVDHQIAVIGNVCTHPEYRRRGHAAQVCAELCTSLLTHVSTVCLDVDAGNRAAVSLYRRLGFRIIGEYAKATYLRREPAAG